MAALRSLTRALEVTVGSMPSDTIWLQPGTYSSATGETFPIRVVSGQARIRSAP
ncbi:MAG: DUF1565 domain-containing protein [bacterium]|nr:DUF1565 domain-containing protein [bacterium]